MLILLGYLVVLGTVFGGYLMTGGSLGALYQPAELVIIAGAGIGSFIVGNNGKAIKGTLKALPLLFPPLQIHQSNVYGSAGAALPANGEITPDGHVFVGARY